MASLRKRGRTWSSRYIDENGIQRERKGFTDKRETERLAAGIEEQVARVRAGLVDPKAHTLRDHQARPIDEHLAEFRAMLTAKNGPGRHAIVTRNRAAKVLDRAGVRRIGDLSAAKVLEALARIRADEDFGQETVNHHVRAVKAFARWLWKEGRAREHYLAHLATASPEGNPSPGPPGPHTRRGGPPHPGRRAR